MKSLNLVEKSVMLSILKSNEKFQLLKEYINVPIFIGSFLCIKRGILC